jgi:hypothetical protein
MGHPKLHLRIARCVRRLGSAVDRLDSARRAPLYAACCACGFHPPSPALACRTSAERHRMDSREQARRLPTDGAPRQRRRSPATRNGHDRSLRFPLIFEAANLLPVRSCLIDGEAVACDDNGLSVFGACWMQPGSASGPRRSSPAGTSTASSRMVKASPRRFVTGTAANRVDVIAATFSSAPTVFIPPCAPTSIRTRGRRDSPA